MRAPVAQLDRAPDFESGGQGFESLPARHKINDLAGILGLAPRIFAPFLLLPHTLSATRSGEESSEAVAGKAAPTPYAGAP
jgi:hypothetical protein